MLVLAVRGLREGLHRLDLARYPLKYTEYVENAAAANGVDPLLIYAVIRTESGFDPSAESNVGARGLMQITEVTFDWIKSKIAPGEDLTFDDLYDPAVNIRFGVYYVSACLERYHGDVSTTPCGRPANSCRPGRNPLPRRRGKPGAGWAGPCPPRRRPTTAGGAQWTACWKAATTPPTAKCSTPSLISKWACMSPRSTGPMNVIRLFTGLEESEDQL